jgi:hypothetical protein
MDKKYYIPNVKTKEEFLERFYTLFHKLDEKPNKSTSENSLIKRLNLIKNNLENEIPLPSQKKSYCNMLPYFELAGGWEMMKSDIGKEATDLLYYFVQNY